MLGSVGGDNVAGGFDKLAERDAADAHQDDGCSNGAKAFSGIAMGGQRG
jgi:hypothetical protein